MQEDLRHRPVSVYDEWGVRHVITDGCLVAAKCKSLTANRTEVFFAAEEGKCGIIEVQNDIGAWVQPIEIWKEVELERSLLEENFPDRVKPHCVNSEIFRGNAEHRVKCKGQACFTPPRHLHALPLVTEPVQPQGQVERRYNVQTYFRDASLSSASITSDCISDRLILPDLLRALR